MGERDREELGSGERDKGEGKERRRMGEYRAVWSMERVRTCACHRMSCHGLVIVLMSSYSTVMFCHTIIMSWHSSVMALFCHGVVLSWHCSVVVLFCYDIFLLLNYSVAC